MQLPAIGGRGLLFPQSVFVVLTVLSNMHNVKLISE